MGITLYSKYGKLYWPSYDWYYILLLANKYGWNPAGTEWNDSYWDGMEQRMGLKPEWAEKYGNKNNEDDNKCETKGWCGSYISIMYQCVNAEDACNLADALEKAFTNIVSGKDNYDDLSEEISGVWLYNYSNSIKEEKSLREHIQDFIKFCRKGGFVIG